MKKIFFILASALMFTACGSGDVVEEMTSIYKDATEKIAAVKTPEELAVIEQEVDNKINDLYASNKQECDLLAQRIKRYLKEKRNNERR